MTVKSSLFSLLVLFLLECSNPSPVERTVGESFHEQVRELSDSSNNNGLGQNLFGARQISPLCGENDCPEFVLVEETENYQLRCFPSYKWVCTQAKGPPFRNEEKVMNKTFERLYMYSLGENEDQTSFELAYPVMKKYELNKHRFTRCFFLPYHLQDNPPLPTNPKVTIVRQRPHCVYTASYEGIVTYKNDRKAVSKLQRMLRNDGLGNCFYHKNDQFLRAGYGEPVSGNVRTVEISLVKKFNMQKC